MPATWLEHFLPLAWMEGTEWGTSPETADRPFATGRIRLKNVCGALCRHCMRPTKCTLCEYAAGFVEDHLDMGT
jgi:hypothetical protein